MHKLLFFCISLLYGYVLAPDPILPIREFLQTNLVGLPVLHNEQTWIFDPEIALRRRRQFIQLHGDKGDRLIERLGLGIDGYEEERLQIQRQRDADLYDLAIICIMGKDKGQATFGSTLIRNTSLSRQTAIESIDFLGA